MLGFAMSRSRELGGGQVAFVRVHGCLGLEQREEEHPRIAGLYCHCVCCTMYIAVVMTTLSHIVVFVVVMV
jgi:hypothetical protein